MKQFGFATMPAIALVKRSDGSDHETGQYLWDTLDGVRRDKTTDVRCPYCSEPMTEETGTGQAARIVDVIGKNADGSQTVTAHAIPKTHETLKCQTCKSVFTLPKHEKPEL